jgi:hypothetical protein
MIFLLPQQMMIYFPSMVFSLSQRGPVEGYNRKGTSPGIYNRLRIMLLFWHRYMEGAYE